MTLPFPSTPILDDGERPDENPLSQGGEWVMVTGDNPTQLVSGTFRATDTGGGQNQAYRGSFTDCEGFFTVSSFAGQHQIWLRTHNSSGGAISLTTQNGYLLSFNDTSYFVYRVTNNANSLIMGPTTWASHGLSFANGARCGGRMVGTSLEAWFAEAAGSFVFLDGVGDTNFASGAIGYRQFLTSRLDSFGGGQPSDSVGGGARLVGPIRLAGAAATLYSADRRTMIATLHVSNPSGSAIDMTMSVGADAAGTRIFDGYSIPADSQREFRLYLPLAIGQSIQGFASTADTLLVEIDGHTI